MNNSDASHGYDARRRIEAPFWEMERSEQPSAELNGRSIYFQLWLGIQALREAHERLYDAVQGAGADRQ